MSDRWPQQSKLRAKIWTKAAGSEDPKSLDVVLEEACDGEMCPLTLEAIRDDELDFMLKASFLERFPNHKKMTLPCGHSFGAMSITLCFCENSLICPCCRRGIPDAVDIDLLPEHIRDQMSEHLLKIKERTLDQRRIDEGQSLSLYFSENLEELDTYLEAYEFILALLIYTTSDEICESCQVMIPLVREEDFAKGKGGMDDRLRYCTETTQVKQATELMWQKDGKQLALATYMRAPSGTIIAIDATPRFDCCAINGAYCDTAGRHGRETRFQACIQPATAAVDIERRQLDLQQGTAMTDWAVWAVPREALLRMTKL